MDKTSIFALVPIFLVGFLACAAAAPVSLPASRFVWEPGENLTFTWTNENFDGFYYDAQRAGNESLTIKIANIKDRYIPKNGITYFKMPGRTNTHYRLSRKYAVLEFGIERYLVEYPEDRSDIRSSDGEDTIRLNKILIDENASHKVENGSCLPLSNGHDIVVRSVNLSNASVLLSLRMDGVNVDTRDLGVADNFIYEAKDGKIIALHVDSVIAGLKGNSVLLNGIFQTSERLAKNMNGNIFGMMVITDVSDTGITMKNTAGIVELKPGQIIDIGIASLKVADSNTLRFCLYGDSGMENNEHRGSEHTDLNDLRTWDGLNYPGFMYDINTGNYSESLEIINITGRKIPKDGLLYTSYLDRLTYTSFMTSVPNPVTKIYDKKPPGTDWSYDTFSLGGDRYILKNKTPELLTAYSVSFYDKSVLGIGPFKFNGEVWELDEGYTNDEPGGIPNLWDLGDGYTLRATYVNSSEDPRKVLLMFKRNGVELEEVWLKQKDIYRFIQTDDNEIPKLITYLDIVFSGDPTDIFQLRNTWLVSDNITRIKEGDRLGVFNVTAIKPDRIVLTNREPIELKAGSRINLYGNLSFYVKNSDELSFYPTNMRGTIVIPEVSMNNMSDIPYSTIPASPGSTEKISGFEIILPIAILLAVKIGKKRRK